MNGSYLVFRQLRQDVPAFWKFIDEQTKRIPGARIRTRTVRLASKMIGRWPSGTPLVKAPNVDDPALCDDNDFFYSSRRRSAGLEMSDRRAHPPRESA